MIDQLSRSFMFTDKRYLVKIIIEEKKYGYAFEVLMKSFP